jgi:hypothetical protein
VATGFDAATPTDAWFGFEILLAVEPTVVSRAFQGIYARFFEPVVVAIESKKRVVSAGGVVSNTTPVEAAMVSRMVFGVRPRPVEFEFHDMVVTRAEVTTESPLRLASYPELSPCAWESGWRSLPRDRDLV